MSQITIGRNAQSTIVVDAKYGTVSGSHATITCNGDTLLLQDHSTNGTYVNGVHIHHQSCQIRKGDNVTLGSQYPLNLNEVYSLLGVGNNTVRKVAPATERMPHHNYNQHNQQVNINIGGDAVSPQQREQPAYLNKWNWGAFYFGWLWGVCNGVYWPLIILIPYLGQIAALVICFILGANGSRYAWEKFSGTAAEFDAKQESWANAAGICFIITIIIGIIAGIAIAANL